MIVGIGGKQAGIFETMVTANADGDAFDSGATITFPKPFDNMPAGGVIPPLGSVDLDDQVGTIWELSSLSTTACTIGIVGTPLPAAFRSQTFKVGVFVHEQL